MEIGCILISLYKPDGKISYTYGRIIIHEITKYYYLRKISIIVSKLYASKCKKKMQFFD